MACYKPLVGYRARRANPSGRRPVVFSREDGFADLEVPLPCGRCIGCRLERSRQWATRCMHEASLWLLNCSLTLTYSDRHLPMNGSLVPNDSRNFIRRVRRQWRKETGNGMSYFLCGEYGGKFGRAHYHVLLFGVWPSDAHPCGTSKSGAQLYRSEWLARLWPYGHVDVGTLTFESAAYAARYVVDKINGDMAAEHYKGRLPEFVRMSLKPAIGKRWFERYRDDVYPSDEVVVRGVSARPPLYYDRLEARRENGADWMFDTRAPEEREVLEKVKEARAKKGLKSLRNRTPKRLAVREEVARAKLNLYKKSGG